MATLKPYDCMTENRIKSILYSIESLQTNNPELGDDVDRALYAFRSILNAYQNGRLCSFD